MDNTPGPEFSTDGHHRRKCQTAFSLIELLVVIAIMGVLVTAIAPSLSYGPLREMTRSTMDIATLLEQAKAHAAAYNVKVDVAFRSDGDGVSAVVVTRNDEVLLKALSKIYHFSQVRLVEIPQSDNRPRADFEVGKSPENAIQGVEFRNQNFPYVVRFNSRGEARTLTDELSQVIEIGLFANIKGATPKAFENNFGVIQIAGLSGGITTYQP